MKILVSKFFRNSFLKSRLGFSVLETMIAIGVIAVVTAGVGSFMYSTLKQVVYANQKVDRETLQSAIESSFRRSKSCVNNLAGINLASGVANFSVVKDYNELNNDVATVVPGLNMDIFPNSKLRVTSMQIVQTNATAAGASHVESAGAKQSYVGDIRITLANPDTNVALAPIIISPVIFTMSGGVITDCQSEQLGSSVTTCKMLGMVWDTTESACVPLGSRSCSKIGGTWNTVTLKCEIAQQLTMQCPTGEAIQRYVNGVPVCEPLVTGIWGDWPTTCPTSCGWATIYRTCAVGTCVGTNSTSCAYFTPPTASCGYQLVDKIAAPPGSCYNGGGSLIYCSSTFCPHPPGTRWSYDAVCDMLIQ